ncbi:crotonase [candidate division TA06 bacterium SM1_40]|uniref:Crotonase n=2 Tax=Bacteria division TA06 TaxID=1156500 RepID=A0A0S8JJB8_UNCT6|nr:MAG: crotonase [candidate division TA06 bacterium SM23_40]KPL09881.1 MAG: crotonase [candidate division TA06 bacterium SM1_40]
MEYKHIRVERDGAIAILTIDRQKVLNALNHEVVAELDQSVEELGADSEVRGVVITGAGEKAFVAGADIAEMRDLDRKGAIRLATTGQAVLSKIERLPKPVIAAINGYALGGGCELALACDVRVAAESAKLGQPEVTLGIIPGYGGTQRLSRLVGKGKAKELIFSGSMIDAQEALRIGLVEHVVPREEVLAKAIELAKTMAGQGPLAVAAAKRAIDHGLDISLEEGLRYEADQFGDTFETKDKLEGTSAFLEKRKPSFTGT